MLKLCYRYYYHQPLQGWYSSILIVWCHGTFPFSLSQCVSIPPVMVFGNKLVQLLETVTVFMSLMYAWK